jgi:hypothetical protein
LGIHGLILDSWLMMNEYIMNTWYNNGIGEQNYVTEMGTLSEGQSRVRLPCESIHSLCCDSLLRIVCRWQGAWIGRPYYGRREGPGCFYLRHGTLVTSSTLFKSCCILPRIFIVILVEKDPLKLNGEWFRSYLHPISSFF